MSSTDLELKNSWVSDPEKLAADNKKFDKMIEDAKNPKQSFKLRPVSPIERLEAWHAAIGSPKNVAEAKIKKFKEDIASGRYHPTEEA
jgi:hypothetical protein